ncbi:NLR family CARD domain-containing protein 3-like isoform X4 [Trematomus bernacchii]|uniref:NLR family CARD domain-containing protein 3-like isoform X4 n=1 Tax=Trematomus bernacchii TaxID=40690 RepID=UPI00146A2620|nr:NLR family CARD domain-containing protein 3-like isoform X4 [Trematomus bernacchii]
MGDFFTTGQALDPETAKFAENQRGAGSTTGIAQDRSVVNQPQLTHFSAGTVNINTYGQAPDRTDNINSSSSQNKANIKRCQAELKSYIENSTKNLYQGTKDDGSLTPLKEIYTELYITKGGSGEVNNEHEVIQLECRRNLFEEKKIQLNDILNAFSNEHNPPQRVLTTGIAGIGKSVAVQKFLQDWAAGEANQTTQFIFPFTFRDLNLIKDKPWSLMTLIGNYFEEVKDFSDSDYCNSSVLFIFDGLDESKLPLDFENNEMCRSVTKITTVDVLLTNLISGKLLHKAWIWITGRPAAAAKIPPKFIDRVTEVRGFNDKQKEQYFQRKVCNNDTAQKILDHLMSKPLRSLYIMCHIPVFCWITATALEDLLNKTDTDELPKTVTEMYTHFLVIQTKLNNQKDYQEVETDKDVIMKLGKLAFEQLQKGNIIFYEKDLESCKIDLTQAAVYSGVCTQIIRKEHGGLHKQEVYSFIHLSVQEFLAALYVLETFLNSGENVLSSQTRVKVASETGEVLLLLLHTKAVNTALASDGQWDLFLRFLLGLSQDSNQKLLQKVFGFKERYPQSTQETIIFIHEKIRKLSNTDKTMNLFQCLNELGDKSLLEQVQKYLRSGDVGQILPSHWSALAFLLLVSNEDLDVFDLKKYNRSDEVLERLLPVLKASRVALLSDCNLTDRCCKYISEVLSSMFSGLEELDLSRNGLHDSGVRLLSDGLRSPNCKLKILRLAECQITESGCAALASCLKSNPAHLRVLDLAHNKLQDGGVENLSQFLEDPLCQLETLNLSFSRMTAVGCGSLTSALSGSSALKELDLSNNSLKDEGANQISDLLRNPECRLKILRLAGCLFNESGCAALGSSLKSNPAHLRVLDLAQNNLQDGGVEKLSLFLAEPLCQLESLNLNHSRMTAVGCGSLTSALSGSSALKELDLSNNSLMDEGANRISALLRNPHCRLKILRLAHCQFTKSGCAALGSSLKSNPAHLRVLDLAHNDLQDGDVEKLSEFLEDPLCQLETLNLNRSRMTAVGCGSLTSALSGSSALKELDMSYNHLMDEGANRISDLLRNPQCRLKILRLAHCQFTKSGCAALGSSLKSNPAHLRVLDLAHNDLQDGDVEKLSEFLEDPLCQLETLNLNRSRMTAVGCGSLTSALSGSSALKELDMSYNHLMDEGANRISDLLRNPQCRLKILRLAGCQFTESGCAALGSSLKSNPAHLRILDLAQNDLQDGGVEKLSEFLEDPLCQLETLNLNHSWMTAVGYGSLTSALSGSSALKELDLSFNSLMGEGAIWISDLLRNPQCRLKILRLASCEFTESGCAALASSLKSNPAHLRVLDLSHNKLQDGVVEKLSEFLLDPLCQLETLDLKSCKLNVACLRSLTLAFSGSSALKELDLSNNHLMDEEAILLSYWLRKPQCRLKILRLVNCWITERGCAALTSSLKSNPHLRVLGLT